MWLLTTNSMRASPTPSAGMRHQRNAAAGLAMLSITLVRVAGALREIDLARFELGGALVDEALLALRAGDGDLLLVVQHLRCVAGADHGRQAELAADDGGVRGAPAVIGDDRRRPLHDRHPVRIGGLRDQHRAVDEAVDLARAVDQADACPPPRRRRC